MLSYIFYTALVVTFPFLLHEIFQVRQAAFQISGIFFVSTVYSLPLAYRGITGTDSLQYYTTFTYGQGHWKRYNTVEAGFSFFMDICRNAKLPIAFFYFWIAFVSLLCFCLVLYLEQNRVDVFLAAFYYSTTLYVRAFNICRQVMAISIVLLAVDLALRGKRIIPMMLVVFACLFHISAIIGLAVIIVIYIFQLHIPVKYIRMLGIIATVIVLYCVCNPHVLSRIVQTLFDSTYYAGYFSRENLHVGTIIKNLLVSLPIAIVVLSRLRSNDFWTVIMVSLSVFGLLITSMGGDTGRIGLYLSVFCALTVALRQEDTEKILNTYAVRSRNIRIVAFLLRLTMFLYLFAVFVFHYLYKNYGEIIPYIPMW